MNEAQQLGCDGSANALVLYQPPEPEALHAYPAIPGPQAARRALRLFRTALLVWGGISLAGVAGAALLYGNGGLGVDPGDTAAQPVVSRTNEPAAPLAARLHAPGPATAADAATAGSPAKRMAALHAPDPVTVTFDPPSPAAAALQPPRVGRGGLLPGAGLDPGPSQIGETPVAARLPQARPDPLTTGSIERRRYASHSSRRFRRLRDLPFGYRARPRYYSYAPAETHRPPPFFESW